MKQENKNLSLKQDGFFNALICSGTIIIQKRDGVKKVLLVKHGEKTVEELKWKFPGGKLLKGWNVKENAIRETKEEIGVKPKIIATNPSVVSLWNQIPESGIEIPEFMILLNYLAEINQEPVAGKEIKKMQWIDIENLPNDCSPNIKPGIEDYKNLINSNLK